MSFKKVIDNREIRAQRHTQPYLNLREAIDQCKEAGQKLVNDEIIGDHRNLLERSVVIAFVTHVEVYFRDMLDAIFKHCNPDFFIPKLKQIHNIKYDIEDLIDIYRKQIHPLELVSSDISFQNADKIEKIFSKFLEKGLWGETLKLRLRVQDKPETETGCNQECIQSLSAIFSLRHELVHNPRNDFKLTEEILNNIVYADFLLLAADVVLCKMLTDNKDPELIHD
nr:HEPN domain-containing protein [uncultured Cohaesibacter sp.]